MAEARKAVLIHNPRAGQRRRGDLLDRLAATLDEEFDLELTPTRAPGDATELARVAARAGVDVAFALGGDGTLREVAVGLLGSTTALAPLPSGTTNVVVRSLGVPRDALAAARLLVRTPVSEMDVGLCGAEPFLMQVSAGLDGAVLRRVNLGLKRVLGQAAVALAGAGAWWSYDYREIGYVIDGQRRSASFLAVGNLPHYAGSMRLFPGIVPNDRCLAFVAFRGGRARTLGFAAALVRGAHTARLDVDSAVVDHVVIESPAGIPLQIDGDPFDVELPVEIRLAEERLRVLAPALTTSAPSR